MRVRVFIAVTAAAIVVAGLISGIGGALLLFVYAIPVGLLASAAAKRSEPPG